MQDKIRERLGFLFVAQLVGDGYSLLPPYFDCSFDRYIAQHSILGLCVHARMVTALSSLRERRFTVFLAWFHACDGKA